MSPKEESKTKSWAETRGFSDIKRTDGFSDKSILIAWEATNFKEGYFRVRRWVFQSVRRRAKWDFQSVKRGHFRAFELKESCAAHVTHFPST
jgi:hypothetical protein